MAYGDDTKFEEWLDLNGFTKPDGAPSSAQSRQRGSAYVNARSYPGSPTGGFAQEDAWPRTSATAYGQAIPSDVTPVAIEHAAYAAGYFDMMNPGVLTNRSSADQRLKRKKERVEGAVEEETEYFDSGAGGTAGEAVSIPMADGLLAPFLRNTAGEPTIFIV